MTTRLNGIVSVILGVAFAFGILTLWIPEMWPWAVFQSVVLVTAGLCLFFSTGNFSAWLVLPLSVPLIGTAQLVFLKTADAWQTRRAVSEWITYTAAAFLAFLVCRDSHLREQALRGFAIAAAL